MQHSILLPALKPFCAIFRLFAACLLLSGLVRAQAPDYAQAPARKVKVEEVRIEGNRSVDVALIRSSLRFTAGEEYLMPVLQDRVRESIRSLQKLGLFADVEFDYEKPDTLEGLVFYCRVKELPTLGKTVVKGNDKLDEDDIRKAIDLLDGQVVSPAAIERDRQKILDLYKTEGFLLAEVKVKDEEDRETARRILYFEIEEGPKVKVDHIRIHGNDRVKARKLRGRMATKEKTHWFFGVGGEYKEEEFIGSLDSILAYYRENGYLDARVTGHRQAYSENKKNLEIDIDVVEGPQYRFGKAHFVHNGVMEEKALAKQVLLDSGEIVDLRKIDGSKFQLEVLYRDIGHLFVQVDEQRQYRDSLLDLNYTISEGGIAHIRKVQVRGNTKTRDKVVRRELKLFPGDVFNQTLVMRSQRDVMQLGFFDNVAPFPEPVGNDDVDLVFDVKERESGTGTLSAGVSYSARDAMVGTFALSMPNLAGRGQKADLNIEYGAQKEAYSVGFTEPWFFDTPTLVGGSLYYENTDNYNYRSDGLNGSRQYIRYGLRTRLGRRLTWPDDYCSVYGNYNLTQNENGQSNDPRYLLLQSGLESSAGLTFVRDDKDLPIFPTEGSKYSFTWSKVGGALGGDFDYSKYETAVNWWFPTVGKLVLGVETQFGIISGPNIQQYDLYQMGGMLGFNGKMRGYADGSVGRERIGRSYLSFVSELTYPVAPNIFYLLGFYDMGNVFGNTTRASQPLSNSMDNPLEEVDFTDLLKDYGLGFRLVIPMVGILGFDFGWHLGPAHRNGELVWYDQGMRVNFVIMPPF